MLYYRAILLISLNKDLYSFLHNKCQVILQSGTNSIRKQIRIINFYVHLLVEQRVLYKRL